MKLPKWLVLGSWSTEAEARAAAAAGIEVRWLLSPNCIPWADECPLRL